MRLAGGRPAALTDVSLDGCRGREPGDRRPLGQRQVDAGEPAAALLRRRLRAACASTAATCATIELASLREQIAVVSQDVVLFDDTIRNNIAFGRDVPDAAIERAAEAAHMLEFIAQPAGGTRCAGRRSRHAALGRAAPAHRDRARAAEGCADPDPRRGDLGARHRGRAPHPGSARAAGAQSHHLRHRAPPVHRGAGRPHHRARCRRRIVESGTHAAAAGAAEVCTPSCIGCSSPTEAPPGGMQRRLTAAVVSRAARAPSLLQPLALALRRAGARAPPRLRAPAGCRRSASAGRWWWSAISPSAAPARRRSPSGWRASSPRAGLRAGIVSRGYGRPRPRRAAAGAAGHRLARGGR